MEKYSVVVSIDAKSDIEEIYQYFADINEVENGKNILEKIKYSIADLQNMPFRHPILNNPFLKLLEIRMQKIISYLIFYRIKNNEVQVVRILHERRNWKDVL